MSQRSPISAAASRKAIAAMAALVLAGLTVGVGCHLDWSFDAAAAVDGGAESGDAGATPTADGAPNAPLDCDGALVCTTFADGQIVPPFAQTFIGPGGAFRVDLDSGAPPHDSTLYVLRPSTTQAQDSAYAQTKIFNTQTFTQASLAVDVFPVQIDSATAHACVLGIGFNDALPAEHVIRLMVGSSGSNIQDRVPNGVTSHDLNKNLPLQEWSRVTLNVTLNATTGGHVTVFLGDEKVLDTTLPLLGASSSATKAFIGINFTELATSAYAFRFDNVRFDAH